jgi:hypothetical protein
MFVVVAVFVAVLKFTRSSKASSVDVMCIKIHIARLEQLLTICNRHRSVFCRPGRSCALILKSDSGYEYGFKLNVELSLWAHFQ